MLRYVGIKLDEQSTVLVVSVICNLLYCTAILLGFLWFDRNLMLVVVLLTFAIGPVIIFVILGLGVAFIVLMAFCPMITVAGIWFFHFLHSNAIQNLGKWLKLDEDKDGTVDIADFVAWAAEKWWGKWLGMTLLKSEIDAARAKSLDAIIKKCIDSKFKELSAKIDELKKSLPAA